MGGTRKRTRRKRQALSVKGVPGGDCDSCSDWLLKNISKTRGRRAKIGGIARDQFEILLDNCIRALLEHALPLRHKDTTTKEWSGRILAKLHASLKAHQWKLARENPAHREWKAKWEKTRADVLVPKSEISQMVREELINAESYQFQLGVAQDMNPSGWKDWAQRKGIPLVYWPTIGFGRFCARSEDKWWDWLWTRILKDKEMLLPGRDPSKLRTQIRKYFLALVDAREAGTF